MADMLKTIVNPLSYLANLRFLIRASGQRTIFPLYHAVSDEELAHLSYIQNVRNVETFESDLETLLKFFTPVSLRDYLSGKPSRKNRVVLTFDDGLRECHDIIAPILARKGIPAVFFLNASFLDNKDLFYRYKASLLIEHYCKKDCTSDEMDELLGVEKRYVKQSLLKIGYDQRAMLDQIASSSGFSFEEYLVNHPVYLTGVQVQSLIKDGFEIGSHSFDHPRFSKLPPKTIRDQVLNSIDALNRRFGLKTKYFAFPFTSDGVPLDVINNLLVLDKVDALMGTSGLKTYTHPGFIQRIPMEERAWPAYRILKIEYLYYYLKAPFGRNRYRGGQ